MLIGVPKEIKPDEYWVALTPAGTEMLAHAGHDIVIKEGARLGSGFTDDFYEKAGAAILETADEVWAKAEMIMKVKELIAQLVFADSRSPKSSQSTPSGRPSGARWAWEARGRRDTCARRSPSSLLTHTSLARCRS